MCGCGNSDSQIQKSFRVAWATELRGLTCVVEVKPLECAALN